MLHGDDDVLRQCDLVAVELVHAARARQVVLRAPCGIVDGSLRQCDGRLRVRVAYMAGGIAHFTVATEIYHFLGAPIRPISYFWTSYF